MVYFLKLPADIMGQMIKDVAPEQTELIIYPDTGHAFLPAENMLGMANGGTIENNTQSQIDSDAKLLQFLEENHN